MPVEVYDAVRSFWCRTSRQAHQDRVEALARVSVSPHGFLGPERTAEFQEWLKRQVRQNAKGAPENTIECTMEHARDIEVFQTGARLMDIKGKPPWRCTIERVKVEQRLRTPGRQADHVATVHCRSQGFGRVSRR